MHDSYESENESNVLIIETKPLSENIVTHWKSGRGGTGKSNSDMALVA